LRIADALVSCLIVCYGVLTSSEKAERMAMEKPAAVVLDPGLTFGKTLPMRRSAM
jgi:hypothetical protein